MPSDSAIWRLLTSEAADLHVDVYRLMTIIGSLDEAALTAERKQVGERAAGREEPAG